MNSFDRLLRLLIVACLNNAMMNVRQTDGKVIGGFVIPHGGIALSPSTFDAPTILAKQWAWQLHKASVQVGQYIRSLKPDLILLSTPHGTADVDRFAFYLNSNGSGTAETDSCHCPPCCYELTNVSLAASATAALLANLSRDGGLQVTGQSFFGPPGNSESAPLRWGEVNPLLFIKDLGTSKVIILSHPVRRYNHSVRMIPELLELGSKLYRNLNALKQSVVVIISSDLAHTHSADGPYGFDPAAKPFDKACGDWASTLHPFYLLDQAAGYARKAKSCGFTGLVMLHGMLKAGGLSRWSPALLANHYPSYYGMMVASFTPTPMRQKQTKQKKEQFKNAAKRRYQSNNKSFYFQDSVQLG